MAIVENQRAAEIPWRPGYRRFTLAGPEQGVACSASLSVIEPGAGAPTHFNYSRIAARTILKALAQLVK